MAYSITLRFGSWNTDVHGVSKCSKNTAFFFRFFGFYPKVTNDTILDYHIFTPFQPFQNGVCCISYALLVEVFLQYTLKNEENSMSAGIKIFNHENVFLYFNISVFLKHNFIKTKLYDLEERNSCDCPKPNFYKDNYVI